MDLYVIKSYSQDNGEIDRYSSFLGLIPEGNKYSFCYGGDKVKKVCFNFPWEAYVFLGKHYPYSDYRDVYVVLPYFIKDDEPYVVYDSENDKCVEPDENPLDLICYVNNIKQKLLACDNLISRHVSMLADYQNMDNILSTQFKKRPNKFMEIFNENKYVFSNYIYYYDGYSKQLFPKTFQLIEDYKKSHPTEEDK